MNTPNGLGDGLGGLDPGTLSILPEPRLEFRYDQGLTDPRTGLALFGPWDADSPSRPGNISYGVIGTAEGIAKFRRFAGLLRGPIVSNPERHHHRIWRPYPGFDAAFAANWPADAAWTAVLDGDKLHAAAHHGDEYLRAYEAAQLYVDAMGTAAKRDESLRLVFCIVPDAVHRNCRPKSTLSRDETTGLRPSAKELQKRRRGQLDLLGGYDQSAYQYSVDFRRQLKARSMMFGIPLQLLRESTLRGPHETPPNAFTRDLTPLSDRAWNIATTAYYKAGGKPWRLGTARPGVCYIGIAFRRSNDKDDRDSACCAAQMFLDTGDGVVFKGEYGPWFSQRGRQFHLSEAAAHDLLKGVLDTYHELGGPDLHEVFVHSRSEIGRDEFRGYREAVREDVKVVGVRVRSERREGVRLFRDGKYPVQRGTLWRLSESSAFLWGSGFEPGIGTYRGAEVPVPLRLDVQHGEADILQVARDVMGLTKLNYNACRPGDRLPVTIGFSDKVGEILIGNSGLESAHPQFKYYI